MDSRIAGLTDFLTSPETAFSFRHLSGDGWTLWISYKLCPFLIAWQMKPTPDKTEVQEKKARTSIGVNCEFLGGGGGGRWEVTANERKSFARICKWNAAACHFWPPPVLRLERWSACVWRWKSSVSFVTICFDLKRGCGETALFTVCGSMSNLYLIYDISHKSSDQRHDPGVFLQIAFSVPQQLWNYSSSRKPLSWTRWSPRMAVAILIWNSSEKVISWS